MRAGTVFDPRYFYHARPTVESTHIAHIEIYEPDTLNMPIEWTPGAPEGQQMTNPWILRWSGQARIQPNKDWRARAREQSGEYTATHAVRIQMGIGKNEHGAVRDADNRIISYGEDPEFGLGWRVHVTEVPIEGPTDLLSRDYLIRNAIISSNTWAYRLLCDTNTHGG